MNSSYEWFAKFAQQGGTVYALVAFAACVAWVMWPSRKAIYEKAARLPLEEGEE
ncbi:MAG: cbb3-type cytochrome c oxidase subunit 3 [Hyphomicrobiales bacterium]|nr:cbb3-type cytochrome c oxidase subunit 3 [Hyphomicrobiales bacterium]MDE2016410.1 cbb3-type cytochrome c oxidase subunit 3 [Hyphomicrobiales bacterium]